MKTKLDFFKEYCKLKGIENKYAFGVVSDSGTRIDFLNGESSNHIMYRGRYIQHGCLYKISEATCSGTCQVGVPAQKCINDGFVSNTKCAVYSCTEVDLDNFQYNFSFEELKLLKKLVLDMNL